MMPAIVQFFLLFCRLLAFECLIKISEILLFLMLILKVTTVLALDALRGLILSVRILVYYMEVLF